MKDSIERELPLHVLEKLNSPNYYIVDYKNINGGEVRILTNLPSDINSVNIENPNSTEIYFDGFSENALEIEVGLYSRQCECVIFPSLFNDKSWILFIETKYTNDLESAFKENNDYPNCMIEQILASVKFFRERGIIGENRRVTAIASFPNLIEAFNSTFFSAGRASDILLTHKVLIRATNKGVIKSNQRFKFA